MMQRKLCMVLAGIAALSAGFLQAGNVVFRTSREGLGENRLRNPGFEQGTDAWGAWQLGMEHIKGNRARTGAGCLQMHSDSTEKDVQYGAGQTLVLNQTTPSPIIVEAWSRADSVSGSADGGYSLYCDVTYTDGTHLWNQNAPFPTGTHDWVRREVTIVPSKPIDEILIYVLLRFHTGTAWFDDVAAYVPERGTQFDLTFVQKVKTGTDPESSNTALQTPSGLELGLISTGQAWLRDTHWQPASATVPGIGFLVRDVAGESDFLRPSLTFGTATAGELHLTGNLSELELQFDAQCRALSSSIEIRAALQDLTGSDRAVSLCFGVPFPATDAVWWDDVSASRPITAGTEYGNWVEAGVGSNGFVSRYPWCAVTSPGCGMSICVPPDLPQVMRMGWSNGMLYITFDLGLTPGTKLHPSRADAVFRLFSHDPAWGFRDAARQVYAMYPRCFEKRVKSEGTWLITRKISAIEKPEDFFLKFHETGARVDPAGIPLGIQSYRYIEPWRWRQRYEGKGTDEQRTNAGSLAILEAHLQDKNPHIQRNSWAVKSSVCYDETGEPVVYIEDAPWGTSALFVCNADPSVPRMGPETVNQADCYYSAEIAESRYGPDVTTPQQDGEYIDSVEGFNWPRTQNYRREHFAGAVYSLTFGTQSRKVCILNAFGHWAFLKQIGDDLHRRGKLMFGNALATRFAYYFTPYFDVLGTEHQWISRKDGSWQPESEARSNYRRTLACQRPYLMLLNTDFNQMSHEFVEKYFRRCAFFGLFPSMFSHDAFHDRYFDDPKFYNRDRDLFRRYLPIILDVARAGWQPVTGMRSTNPAIRLERFGDGSDFYITVLNTDTETSQEAQLTFVLPRADGKQTARINARELISGHALETTGNLKLTVEPDDVQILRVSLQ